VRKEEIEDIKDLFMLVKSGARALGLAAPRQRK
jgi:hypothetical protein